MRCFVALPLPLPLERALDPVRKAVPFGRVVSAENLHLTLAFLGERDPGELDLIHEALDMLTARKLTLRLSGLGTFGEPWPHTLWAGIAGDGAAVEALHDKVMSALRRTGIELQRRRFRPHVTLARLSQPDETQLARLAGFLGTWSMFPCPEAEVTGFTLFRSILGKGDPEYQPLAEYPLR